MKGMIAAPEGIAPGPEASSATDALPLGALEALRASLHRARDAMAGVVLGQDLAIEQLLVGLISGGSVLLEGPPGVGKTLLVRTLSQVTGLSFARLQFTPDLMPSDITGSMMLVPDIGGQNRLEFQPGPIFAQLVLADEINRATPRTQSALLEAMQEHTISAAGRTMNLPSPFIVVATQNPIEMEGTYSLPEAQIDRFLLRVDIGFPSEQMLSTVLRTTTGAMVAPPEPALSPEDILQLQSLVRNVPVAEHVRHAVARFALMTQPHSPRATKEVNTYIRFGVSPRGAQAIVLAAKAHAFMRGHYNVSFNDIRAVLSPATRHRVQLNFEGRAENVGADAILNDLLETSVRQFA